jgi:peptidyl-prolyl cis-trans isomerase B (cyclophilin B)
MSLPPNESATPPPGEQPWQPPVAAQPAPRKGGLSTGGIVAIVAGAVALLLCVGAGILVVIGLRAGEEALEAGSQPRATGPSCEWIQDSTSDNPHLLDVGAPPTDVPHTGTQTMTITTNSGVIEIEMATGKAPCAAASMTHLAGKKFFDNSTCHRITTEGIWVLQCGDPTGTGMGGPTYKYAEENLPNDIDPAKNYPAGTLAMAKTQDPATTGSQFFIVWGQGAPLNGDYTVLGTVTKGMDVVEKIGAAGAVDVETGSPTTDGVKVTDGKTTKPVNITSITVTPAR